LLYHTAIIGVHNQDASPEGSEFELDAWDIEENNGDLHQAFTHPPDLDIDSDMPSHSHTNGQTTSGPQRTPLLKTKSEDYASSNHEPLHNLDRPRRRSSFKERDPEVLAKAATRKRYIYASFFLVVSLISFCIQTETAVYIQANLGWNKAYAMLYVIVYWHSAIRTQLD